MPIVNYASREIQFKIVYYGPALCGKTTNLTYVHARLSPSHRGELVTLATAAERTLYFDFLPVNAILEQGFKTKFQLYTVPGQVIYDSTRQLVLRSVDGVVFVADSQWNKIEENVESFRNLEQNLAKQHLSLSQVPYVLQFNKRDLRGIAPSSYLNFVLNNRPKRVPRFETVATTGINVFATLDAVTQLVLRKSKRENQTIGPDAIDN
jgi:mutual gliding-motility protein MglA